MKAEFKPKMIGTPDQEAIKKITDLYSEIIEYADAVESFIEFIFKDPEFNKIEFLIELQNSNPELLIRQKWVKVKGYSVPGISTEKLIASDLLDIPKYAEVIKGLGELKELYSKAKSLKFVYPLEKLYNESLNTFVLTEEFNSLLLNQFSTFTENENQNELLDTFTQLIDSLNKLANLNIISCEGLDSLQGKLWGSVIKPTHLKTNPFYLNRNVFGGAIKHRI